MAEGKKEITFKKLDLTFLDGLRGLAALFVLVSHARWLLVEGYSLGYLTHPQLYNIFEKGIMYFLSAFRYGRSAVLLFFVLSGFVIHLRYSAKLAEHPETFRFSWRDYIIRRIRRIYPPIIFTIILTYGLDHLGSYLGYAPYHGKTAYFEINSYIQQNFNLSTLFGNLGFVMDHYVPVWGSNGPLWSLKYEWWFYMLYPIFLLISRRSIYNATALLLLLTGATVWPEYWPLSLAADIFAFMICWWFGVLLCDVYTGRIKVKYLHISWLILLLIPSYLFDWRSDITYALGFSGMLALLLHLKSKDYKLKLLTKLKWLGDMSYTLYIIHFPVLVFICGLSLSLNSGSFPIEFWWFFGSLVFVILVSWLIHFIIEKPFTRKH